jgi:hypothetical protein
VKFSVLLTILCAGMVVAEPNTFRNLPGNDLSLRTPRSALARQGGPDGFGYRYRSTQEPGDSVTFEWIDATTGSAITNWYPGPDDGYAALTLPFPFPFYAETLRTINVCSNGFLETSTSTLYDNGTLPTPDITNLIAPFWDDLSLPAGGTVYQFTPADSMYFVIAFVGVARYEPPQVRQTFEVILYPDGRIRLNYQAVGGDLAANTIGIQGEDGTGDWYLQYVANGSPDTHVVDDSTSVLFAADRPTRDVGVIGIPSPAAIFPPGTTQPVVAGIRNFGQQTESFTVGGTITNRTFPFDTIFSVSGVPVAGLAPSETRPVDLGSVTPTYRGTWQVKLFTELGPDEQRSNDTASRQVSNSVAFGAELGSWDLGSLPCGFALGGITFSSDSNRYYVAARDPNQVYSFAPGDPAGTLRMDSFQLQNLFGNDVIWGIAFDRYRHSFWIGHVEGSGNGTIVARYTADGSFTGDTWNLNAVEANTWFAGMDYDPQYDRFYVTKVGGTNAIYKLDFANKHVCRIIPGGPQSYRACSYLDCGIPWILSGGWNQNQLLRLDTLGTISTYSVMDSLADCDVYQPRGPNPDSFVYVMATLSNQGNTIKKISLGVTWRQLGISDHQNSQPPAPNTLPIICACASPQSNPVQFLLYLSHPASLHVTVFDLSGRAVLSLDRPKCAAGPLPVRIPGRIPPGAYFIATHSEGSRPQQKLIVVR